MKDITVDPEVLGGIPVFSGTRVPVKALFDYLQAGDSLNRFLDDFPDVSRDTTVRILDSSIREPR